MTLAEFNNANEYIGNDGVYVKCGALWSQRSMKKTTE